MDYGTILPASFVVPSSSFHLRQDLVRNPFRDVLVTPGAIVMDCGAHIGSFAAAALEAGAGLVHCYEPEPRNHAQLTANLLPYGARAVLHQAALVPAGQPATAMLMLSGFTGAHSTIQAPKGRHRRLEVGTLDFREQLITIRPTVLKVDVEAAEYELFGCLQPGDLGSVQSLFIEFHPIKDRDQRIAQVRALVCHEGLHETVVRPRRYTANRIPAAPVALCRWCGEVRQLVALITHQGQQVAVCPACFYRFMDEALEV